MEDEELLIQYLEDLERERAIKLSENNELIQNFTKHCSELGIDVATIGFDYIPKIGVVAESKDILTFLDSRLSPDKEGLFDFRYLSNLYEHKPYIPGCFFSFNYIAMLSPLFRRSYTSNTNWAPNFVDFFWAKAIGFSDELEVDIALDIDRVRVDVNESICQERDRWFGPNFKKNIADIKDGSAKFSPPQDVSEAIRRYCFSNVYCLDIDWKSSGNIKSLQAQEFKEEDCIVVIDGINYHPSRYVHAEFDLEKSCFRHFDGAIQFFTQEEYFLRRKTHLRHNYKFAKQVKAKSKKLFKLNGQISTKLWCELSGHFFSQNPLFYEYITGKYPSYIDEMLERVRANTET